MTPTGLGWPTNNPRERTEWDFRARWKGCTDNQFDFLPPEEVWYCHCYEFDRCLSRTVEDVLRWRGNNQSANFEKLLDHYWRTDGNGKEGHPIVGNWFYMIWPEWPQIPYLTIPFSERKRRREMMWPVATKNPRTLQLLPLGEVGQAHVDISKCGGLVRRAFQPRGRGERTVFDGKTFTVWRKDHQDEKEYPHVVAVFEIDFSLSPTRNARLFENWCRAHQAQNNWKSKPNRGQTSDTDRLRTQLIHLGAWRLHESGFSLLGGKNFTRAKSGLSLFADKAEWSRAVKRARELIEIYS
jgi:hypothetical protein